MLGEAQRFPAANQKMARSSFPHLGEVAGVSHDVIVREQPSFSGCQFQLIKLVHLWNESEMRWKELVREPCRQDARHPDHARNIRRWLARTSGQFGQRGNVVMMH